MKNSHLPRTARKWTQYTETHTCISSQFLGAS